MVRRRVPNESTPKDADSHVPKVRIRGRQANPFFSLYSRLPVTVKSGLLLVLVLFTAYFVRQGYLETRISSPLNVPKVVQQAGLSNPAMFWGSYRPGVYFGLKTRSPANVLAGLMWLLPDLVQPNNVGLRHWCDQGDNLKTYGWLKHDGTHFGIQKIEDRGVALTTSFLKWDESQDWSARIAVDKTTKRKDVKSVSLFFYLALDEHGEGTLSPVFSPGSRSVSAIRGHTPTLGHFSLDFVGSNQTSSHIRQIFYSAAQCSGPHKFTEAVMSRLRLFKSDEASQPIIGLDASIMKSDRPDMVVVQVLADLPFQLDLHFIHGEDGRPVGRDERAYSDQLMKYSFQFEHSFEHKFGLAKKGYNESAVRFAQAALSNLVGGIGYFYGHSLVQSDTAKSAVRYWDAPLFSAVPSRSFFPRGFLWDEGFHNLLISKWSPEISADIMAHWMDLINSEGWIPREQILGIEARVRVPAEFVVQRNSNANPPTLILTLHSMVQDLNDRDESPWFKDFLQRMWPRLERWYSWFNTTQVGPVPGSYRWRGRNATTVHELNPKTLTSGLDDAPRASHPSSDERHVDLRCWIALASALMSDIGRLIGRQSDALKYERTAEFLYDNDLLNSLHWSPENQAYLDFGLHTERVRLERPRPSPADASLPDKVRIVTEEPRHQFVNQYGYLGLFPFLLQILQPDSPNLGAIFRDLADPNKFFTPFGLRSLSKDASLYMKRNTEHDPPYWRGPIWININYLAIRALHHYANRAGPHQQEAQRLYGTLRHVVVSNVMKEYQRTGYIWEQYNDSTGQGQGCRPFTGWSTLVVLIMGETY